MFVTGEPKNSKVKFVYKFLLYILHKDDFKVKNTQYFGGIFLTNFNRNFVVHKTFGRATV